MNVLTELVNEDWILTIARMVLGVTILVHGAQKLLGWFGGHGHPVRTFREEWGSPDGAGDCGGVFRRLDLMLGLSLLLPLSVSRS
jgi:hypothetical protein